MNIHNTYIYKCGVGVDQNKRYLGTIADQARINRDPKGANHGRVLSYCETIWREPGPTQAGLAIAEQSRTKRGFHRHVFEN